MLSHDNYVWLIRTSEDEVYREMKTPGVHNRLISYMPMNHVAAQLADMFLPLHLGCQVYFADISALRTGVHDYLISVRPTIFFTVPRIWEKFEEKLRNVEAQQGPIDSEQARKILGLDACKRLLAGAAPLSEKTRNYLDQKGMFINNTYGLSETAGTLAWVAQQEPYHKDMTGVGIPLNGLECFIINPDASGRGEIAVRSRTVFMGYLKNETATREIVDNNWVLKTGDEGCIDPITKVITITGRLKEIIMTSGGENVAPVPIEEQIKKHLPFISNALVIGDQRKYIAAMLAFKVNMLPTGKPTQDLSPEALAEFEKLGIKGLTTVSQAADHPQVKAAITQGVAQANKKAVSHAATVKDWFLVFEDFWIGGGELTPTLKLKRKEIVKKHSEAITKAYSKASE